MSAVAVVRRRSNRPAGFTLVELLVVIMIIALLAAIVTPAVMRSISTARAAAVRTEIELLNTALLRYRQEYGSFPPADMRGLWNNNTQTVNQGHPAYKHLARAFPRIREIPAGANQSPYYYMAQMSPAQALVFWLQGFYDNPEYPLTNNTPLSASTPRAGTVTGSRAKLFDFDETRLFAATPYWPATSPSPFVFPATSVVPAARQEFSSRNAAPSAFAREYPVYFPNMPNAGVPYVYFASTSYSIAPTGNVTSAIGTGPSKDLYYTAVSLAGANTAVAPYFYSTNCSNAAQYSWADLHMNPDTFQLIAGGVDGTYGEVTAGFPLDAIPNSTGTPTSFSFGSYNHGPFPSVLNRTGSSPGHEDNITNFASGPLKAAAEKLLNQ